MLKVIIVSVLFFSSIPTPAYGVDEQGHLSDDDKKTIDKMTTSILATKLAFQLRDIQLWCKDDIEALCKEMPALKVPGCILNRRDEVSAQCNALLDQEFGSKPSETIMIYEGFTIPPGSKVFRLRHNNQIVKVETAKPTVYKGLTLQPGTFNFQSGTIYPIPISEITEIDGLKYSPPSVTFDYNGFVSSGVLAEDTVINGIGFMAGGISLFSKGKVQGGILLSDLTINGVKYKRDWTVVFFESGMVERGVIAEPVTIQGKLYPENTHIAYRKDGSVAYSFPIHPSMLNEDGSRKKESLESFQRSFQSK